MSESQLAYIQLRFLEFICGVPKYRHASSVKMRFGKGWWLHIPHEWYQMKKGCIRLTHAGWSALKERTATVRTAHSELFLMVKAGRVMRIGNQNYWVQPSYLKGVSK